MDFHSCTYLNKYIKRQNASAVCLISTSTGTKAHKIISVFFFFSFFFYNYLQGEEKKKGNQHQGNKTLLKSDNEKEIGLNT